MQNPIIPKHLNFPENSYTMYYCNNLTAMDLNIASDYLEEFKKLNTLYRVKTRADLYDIKNVNFGDTVCVEDEGNDYVLTNEGKWEKIKIGEDCMMFTTYETNHLKDDDSSKKISSLEAENKRLKKQLKELREVIAKLEKTSPEPLKVTDEMKEIAVNIDEKIDEIQHRTFCDKRTAYDAFIKNNYNVESAITYINWSNLNEFSKEIL